MKINNVQTEMHRQQKLKNEEGKIQKSGNNKEKKNRKKYTQKKTIKKNNNKKIKT